MVDRGQLWTMAAIAVAVAVVSAVVTGVVIARRISPLDAATARNDAPAASPTTPVDPTGPSAPPAASPPDVAASRPGPSAATAPASDVPARRAAQTTTPPPSVIQACNQQAQAQTGAGRDQKGKIVEVGKDAGIGAVGGAAVGALGGAIANGGKGAGKGALIGGLVGAGGGTLYGLWDNKKHDEYFRDAYSRCMKDKGYTAQS